MKYRNIGRPDIDISVIGLGTWAFGSDRWWGKQKDEDSFSVLNESLRQGVNLIDTAPVYGRGHSEQIIGRFIDDNRVRENVILATKLGLSWSDNSGRVWHDLSEKKMRQEIDSSRARLKTDVIDIYQVHWPDSNTPITRTASVMYDFYRKGLIRAIGVSNYSVSQMQEFMKYSPLHTLQPPYNMFRREIEEEIIPFCESNKIAILSYIPLHSGILTGKFFFDGVPIPGDIGRKNHPDLKEPRASVNKSALGKLKKIADFYGKTLTQLVLAWTVNRQAITSVLAGARNKKQLSDNIGGVGWDIQPQDIAKIQEILNMRQDLIVRPQR